LKTKDPVIEDVFAQKHKMATPDWIFLISDTMSSGIQIIRIQTERNKTLFHGRLVNSPQLALKKMAGSFRIVYN
jgi:hypothetical protein